MILAAIDWLSISITLLLVVFVIVCLLMTLVILMQRPKQEGLGAAFGAGLTDQVFGARTTNVLQRGTVYLGSAFFILSFLLAILIGLKNRKPTLISDVKPEAAEIQQVPAPEAPKSLSEELPEAPPVTPATPEVEAPALPDAVPLAPEEAPADGSEAPAEPETPAEEAPADSEENPGQP